VNVECFKVDIANNIAHVVLNRPDKRNAMNPAFWRELPEIIADVDENARARVIVISSTGPHFSAGLDLSMFDAGNADESTRPYLTRCCPSLQRSPAKRQSPFTDPNA